MRLISGSHPLVLLTLWLFADVATSQEPARATLTWQDDGSCSAPPDADAQLASLIGARATPGVSETAPLRVAASVESTEPGVFTLTLRTLQGATPSERRVVLASCSEAQETAILLAAMTLDPRPAPLEPEPPPAPADPPSPEEQFPQASAAPARWGLGAHGGVDMLSFPGLTPLGALGATVELSQLRLGLQVRFAASSEPLPEGAEAKLSLFTVAPTACWLWPARFDSRAPGGPAALRWGLCGEAELGRTRASASGVADAETQQSLWATTSAGALLEYSPARSVALQLGMSAGAAFRRPRFALRGQDPFHEVPVAVLRAMIGVTFWLPTEP